MTPAYVVFYDDPLAEYEVFIPDVFENARFTTELSKAKRFESEHAASEYMKEKNYQTHWKIALLDFDSTVDKDIVQGFRISYRPPSLDILIECGTINDRYFPRRTFTLPPNRVSYISLNCLGEIVNQHYDLTAPHQEFRHGAYSLAKIIAEEFRLDIQECFPASPFRFRDLIKKRG